MNQTKKLTFYVGLNIVVSVVTLLSVHYLWENTRLKNLLIDGSGTSPEISRPDSSGDPVEETTNLKIEIGEVGGVGNLATEYIRLTRPGSDNEDTISLKDWEIKDEDNHKYSILEQSGLASLELHSQGAVNIYTKAGSSNPIELYLGLDNPIWQPGETVTLLDPQGEIHDTYLIP
jgi:hypothetical protein